MRRILTLPGLALAAWASYLALMALLSGMLAARAWHPHFLPAMSLAALAVGSGLVLAVGASWRIARGPGRLRAFGWLLIGVAPSWFMAGHVLYGLAVAESRRTPMTPAFKLLLPLAESVMDLEARFRYPMRTRGEKVVMLSPPMPQAEARAQVAAMDRHIRALERRLGRPMRGTVHWARGPLLGLEAKALLGLCLASRPGGGPADDGGLRHLDRHEVAHCVATSHCGPGFAAPAVLIEGWAEASDGRDPVEQVIRSWEADAQGVGLGLRRLTGPDWYDRHEWPAYRDGAALVHFLLRRFGPEKFLELYTTCRRPTFEDDCRRVLGLDLDGLDAAFREDRDRIVERHAPVARYRLERLRLDPGIDPAAWKAFLADYFAAADRLLAPYRHVRLTTVWTRSRTDPRGRPEQARAECQVLRSGEFASVRHLVAGHGEAALAHPRRSILALRAASDAPWKVEDESRHTPDQSRRRALDRVDGLDLAGHWDVVPLIGLAESFAIERSYDHHVVAALERFSEDGRPRVRVRIENRAPAGWYRPWRSNTIVMAADDLYAAPSQVIEGLGPRGDETHEMRYTHDRHEGVPVLRSEHTAIRSPAGPVGTSELTVVERRFGPIPEEVFDPDRFLDGPRVRAPRPAPGEPSLLVRLHWLPWPIGALGLIAGSAIVLGTRRDRDLPALPHRVDVS